MQKHATVTRGTKRYRELTQTKARDKDQWRVRAGAWAGWTLDRPVMRLGGAAAAQAASACAAAPGAQARRWLTRTRSSSGKGRAAKGKKVPRRPAAPREEARPISVAGASTPRGPTRSAMRTLQATLSTMKELPVLVVRSELHAASSEDDLRKWVVAVAFGKLVHTQCSLGNFTRTRFARALDREQNVWFTPRFVRRHAELAKITSAIAAVGGSKWRVWPTAPPMGASSRSTEVIDTSASFVRWLRKVRR